MRPAEGVLWVVQDGVLSGPGASQTVPYLLGLAARGRRTGLLSFERPRFLSDRPRVRALAERLARAGIRWTALSFGRGPSAPRALAQVARGAAAIRGLCARDGHGLVHARSLLPALMARLAGRRFVFDMRGFWPQERVDGGLWREGSAAHRVFTRLESGLLRRAAGVVLLARAARPLLPPLAAPVRVVPTAVDLQRFRPGLPPPEGGEGLAARAVYLVAGALGTWYLLEEMLDLVALALEEDGSGHALILTEEDAAPAVRGLRRRGVPPERITARGVPFAEVPGWFSIAAAGILLIRSAPSKRASCPTKLAELLASGVPVLITPGIGDTEALVRESGAGVVVDELGREGYRRALRELRGLRADPAGLRGRCRRAARERLSLEAAVAEYESLYRELAGGAR